MEREALYPFGYGLTYGDVRVESASVTTGNEDERDVVVRAKLRNVGKAATEDVVQVYVKDPASPYAVPNHSLCAFRRVALQAGECREVEIAVPKEAFLVVDEAGRYVNGSSRCLLYVGTGQPDRRTAVLSGKESVELSVEFSS